MPFAEILADLIVEKQDPVTLETTKAGVIIKISPRNEAYHLILIKVPLFKESEGCIVKIE
jgi:hypothetical protein